MEDTGFMDYSNKLLFSAEKNINQKLDEKIRDLFIKIVASTAKFFYEKGLKDGKPKQQ